jgi:hypothetical protein
MDCVYALLVGIDDYRPPVPPLRGCGNDVDDAARFLREHSGTAPRVAVVQLRDATATRGAVIEEFRRHLGRAGPGDTALFWFSGHGSTAPVPLRWWHLEPSGRLQTLVCADSRHGGVPDLLDKELAVLLREVAARGAHMAVVLDCCHAAGAHRTPAAARLRLAPPLDTPPDPELLLPLPPEPGGGTRAAAAPTVPPAEHIALAACREHQPAHEVTRAGRVRGAFSLALLSELRRPGRVPTYRELIAGARCYVENLLPQQVPVLHPADQAIADQPFLGGRVRPATATMTMRYANGAWEIDAGACHGFPAGTAADPVRVAVHHSAPVREARVAQVLADRSIVAPIDWQPDRRQRFPVVVARVPLPTTTVAIGGAPGDDPDLAARVLAAVESAGPAGGRSPHLRVVPGSDPRQLPELVVATPADADTETGGTTGAIRLLSPDGAALTSDLPDRDGRGAAQAVARLEHIARWRQVKSLANPCSRLAGGIALELVPAHPDDRTVPRYRPALQAGSDGQIALAYRYGPQGWSAPTIFVRLRNTTGRRLFGVLLNLTDRFRIHAGLFPGAFIGPAQVGVAAEGEPVVLALPPGRAVRPGAAVRDWLMLIVSEEEINSALFGLPRLGEPTPAPTRAPIALAGIVERLGRTARDRDIDCQPASARDWWTTIVPVVTSIPHLPASTGDRPAGAPSLSS